jgi:hypothetical protein
VRLGRSTPAPGSPARYARAITEPDGRGRALQPETALLRPGENSIHPSVEAEARGWAAAVTGEFRVEERKTGRGERDSPALTQRSLSFLMVNATPREPPVPLDLARSA